MDWKRIPYMDRFIPNRNNIDLDCFNWSLSRIESLYDIELDDENNGYHRPTFLNTAKKAKYLLSYKKRILDIMHITSSNILSYNTRRKKGFIPKINPWPVHPRQRPLLTKPQSVLDMPDINRVEAFMYHNVIGWGRKGHIATVFFGEVHLWSSSNGVIANTNTGKTVCDCIKWNKSGRKIAVSRTKSMLSVIDGATLKIYETVMCRCRTCTISAIEWTKNDDIITGCSTGSINVMNFTQIRYVFQIVNNTIVDLKLSCNENFLLITTKRNDMYIFNWPLEENGAPTITFRNNNDAFIKAAAWHPWKDSTLVLGALDNKISVWNVTAKKLIDFNTVEPYFKKASSCILDFLSFCPMSGELLVSFYYEPPDSNENNGCNFLTVFSDLHTRVDEIRYHVGRVPHALWNHHGTKLATLGTDENLVIWDFFGGNSNARLQATNQDEKFPSAFDSEFQFGSILR